MSIYNSSSISTFEYETATGASQLSRMLAFLIPLILGSYWIVYVANQDFAILILRPSVLASSFLLALLWFKAPLTQAETRLAAFMTVMCLVLLAPSLNATVPFRALQDCIKLLVMCLIGLCVSRALRHEATAKAFGVSLILAGILAAGLCVYTYIRVMGLAAPTYESDRVFKGVVSRVGIPLNSIAFTSVFAYIAGMCLIRGNRMLWLLGAVLFVIASVLTGSRAPIAVLIISGIVLLLLNGLVGARLLWRVLSWLCVAGVVALLLVGPQYITMKEISSATEGRWDLWWVAWQKFLERPLLGYGYESWRDDMLSRLPGPYVLDSESITNFQGAYHSEYMQLLAEQGLVGLFPVMAFFLLVLRYSWKLAFRRSATWNNHQWALFGCLFLMLRAAVEAPGLFGYGQETADYLAFVFVAIVLSRFSVEEDYLRSIQKLASPARQLFQQSLSESI